MKEFKNIWNKKWETQFWENMEKGAPNEFFKVQYNAFKKGSEFKKLTPNQQRDFDYFINAAKKEKCYENHYISKSNLEYKPKTTEEWFWLWDTFGFSRNKELEQPNVKNCQGIKQAKEFLNLTIKMWVESCLDMPHAFDFEGIKTECDNMLPYLWKGFVNQLHKEYINQIGFVTTFIKNRTGI